MTNYKLAVIRNEYGGVCGYDPREEPTYKSLPKYGIDYEWVKPDEENKWKNADIVEILETNHGFYETIIKNHPFVICTVGDSNPQSLTSNDYVFELIKKNARHFIPRTSHIRQTLINLLIPHTKITMIPRAADVEKWYPNPTLRTVTDFVVLYVGRIDISSGVQYLIPEFLKFAEKKDNVQLVLVGKSIASEGLDKYLKEKYPSPKIKWLGKVPNESLFSIYNNADVFAHLEFYPDNGNHAILEAMACGLPLLGLDLGSLEDRFHEGYDGAIENGSMINAYEDVSSTISYYYLLHTEDKNQLTKTKDEQREFVESTLSSNIIGKQTAELYKSLLDRKDDKDEWSRWYE